MNTDRNRQKREPIKQVRGFEVLEDACIWMKAGVINFRKCDNGYDCNSCPFDVGMRKAMGVNKEDPEAKRGEDGWIDRLKKSYDGAARPCRHALTGRIDAPKICPLNYECFHCSFDQLLDEVDLAQEPASPQLTSASGFRLAKEYYYHVGHSWSRLEQGGRTRIGMDDFASRLFGAPRRLRLPPLGERLRQNQVCWAFERDDREAAVLAPVSGVVLALNHKALEHPEIVNVDPYHEGWLFIVEPVMPKRDLKALFFGDKSVRWMEHESSRLMSLLGPEYENLAATGAEPLNDIVGSFPGIRWRVLVETFLGTGSVTPDAG